jgi:hypothetical protein
MPKTTVETTTVYVIGYDTMFDKEFDSGIRLVKDAYLIDRTLLSLHRSTAGAMYRVVDELPEGIEPFGSVRYE